VNLEVIDSALLRYDLRKFEMELSVREMQETSVTLQRLADEHVASRGHRSVDVANRERAVLQQFQQTYPSNHVIKNYDIGP
jgi:hypothetical protein